MQNVAYSSSLSTKFVFWQSIRASLKRVSKFSLNAFFSSNALYKNEPFTLSSVRTDAILPMPSKFSLSSFSWLSFIFRSSAVQISLAMPCKFWQSPLFAVTSTSMITSLNASNSPRLVPSFSLPILSSSGKIPSFVLGSPSSVEEQIIPHDSMPLSFAFLISRPFGIVVPMSATGTN